VTSQDGRPTARHTPRGTVTKARIVDEAITLLRERGVAGTSLDAVMTASGTSKSQLYHYFADKDALITEVIKAELDRIISQQEPSLSGVTTWDGLERWCGQVVTVTRVTQGVGGCPLGSFVGELAERSESARLELAQSFAEWQSYLSAGFTVMRDNGELVAEADPDELALTMMSALQGGLLMAQINRSARPVELALDMALGHLAGYRVSPTQTSPR
ncbi:TetR family transcriptional regulator, partial [Mycobacterium numidiamassiliense]